MRGLSKRVGLIAILMMLVALFAAPVASSAAATKAVNVGGGDIVAPVFPAAESLSTAMARVQAMVTSRLNQLHRLWSLVGTSKTLTTADESALFSLIDADASGLGLLEVSVTTAPSVAALSADASKMVLDYHVFALATPVVKDVISADESLAQSRDLMRQIPEIEATVSASGLRSQSEARATGLLAQLPNRLVGVQGVLAGVVPAVLALTASSVPASLPVLATAASAARMALADLQAADAIVAHITTIIAGTAPTPRARR